MEKPVLKAGGKYWHVYMSKKTAGGRNTARYLGRYLKKPPIAASRLAHYNGGASLSFRYGPQNGRNGDGNADTAGAGREAETAHPGEVF
uniref:Transposase IS801/IS1294 domain-containing protein n=1 Tax=Escherichia coli TaxID=562 RepID=A0A6C7H159_ECOLX|nr:hypothetical protein EIMP033_0940 [Escherichia coli]